MTPGQVMSAYRAVNELANCAFPYSVTRQVHALKKKLTDEFNVVLEAEKTLVAKYKGTTSENGSYHFETVEAATAFRKEYRDFLNQEGDVDLPKADVSRCFDAIVISAASIDALEGIVIFEEG